MGDKNQIIQLYLHYNIIPNYISVLGINGCNPEILENILKALFKVLLIGNKALVDGKNVMLQKFMESQGVEKVQALQDHESEKVYKATTAILVKFFDVD